jgi:hypothetical protein
MLLISRPIHRLLTYRFEVSAEQVPKTHRVLQPCEQGGIEPMMTDWMTSHGPKFEIPQEFASQLRYREGSVDQKNDEELLRGLTEHVPVTSEKNIWAFWVCTGRQTPIPQG